MVCGGLLIALWLALLTVVDLREHRLPNMLTLPGATAILLGAALSGRGVPALVGAVALAGGYLVIHLISSAAMGAGDVKLALGVGGLAGAFGTGTWMVAALGAPLLTAGWGLLSGRRLVPHGPAMCLATAVAVGSVIGRL